MGAATTILVVEDEADIRDMFEMGLRFRGYEPLLASTGEEALALFDSHHVDLVISDIKMPGMGGVATVSQLRVRAADLPIIVVTGYMDQRAIDDCLRLGSVDVLRKPFSFDTLANAVELRLRSLHRQP